MTVPSPAIRPEIEALELSGIGKIAAGALNDPEVVPLWFGESDIVTADFIRDAAKEALDRGTTFYDFPRGHLRLRDALKAYLERIYEIEVDPARLSSPGSTMLTVMQTCQSMIRPGDEIILVSPFWPNIKTCVEVMGGHAIDVRLDESAQGWSLDLGRVQAAITPRTRAVYVNSPSNPTGWIMTDQEQLDLLDLCRHHGLGLIADEVYHRNVFEGPNPAPSFMTKIDDDEPVFILNGFSKAWAMTGWRIGWMVHPRRLAVPMAVLAEVNNTGSTSFAQYGAIAALEKGETFIENFLARTRENRDLVMTTLGAHPRVDLAAPQGAFYAFPRIEGVEDSLGLCRRILAEAKVGTAAGYAFGQGNDDHIRLCFAIAKERLEPALHRVMRVLDGI